MPKAKIEKHIVLAENAAKIKLWMETRGGIAIWGCVDLSNAGRTWDTPKLNKDGVATEKPHWSATMEPIRIITDPAEIEVQTAKEVRRFRVGLRRGDNGLKIKLTGASSDRVKREVARAGEEAFYDFDYEAQEAVIYVPGSKTPLAEWKGV